MNIEYVKQMYRPIAEVEYHDFWENNKHYLLDSIGRLASNGHKYVLISGTDVGWVKDKSFYIELNDIYLSVIMTAIIERELCNLGFETSTYFRGNDSYIFVYGWVDVNFNENILNIGDIDG